MAGRLPRVTGTRLIRSFQRAGWKVTRVKGDHYLFIHPRRPGRLVQIQYHNRDLTTGLLARIERDSGYSRQEFIRVASR